MRIGSALLFVLTFIAVVVSHAQQVHLTLPQSVLVITGVPLTIPEPQARSMNLRPEQNTGGWGDVMSNITMAQELKLQFPAMTVRLVVTLNDAARSVHVNRVRSLVEKIFVDDRGRAVLDPDSRKAQTYNGVEVYFVSLPAEASRARQDDAPSGVSEAIEKAAAHIPVSDVAIQFSANDAPVAPELFKASRMRIHLHEFIASQDELAFVSLEEEPDVWKLNSGPRNLGAYGFGTSYDRHGSAFNQRVLKKWWAQVLGSHPRLNEIDLSRAELAFAYAGDADLVADYVTAMRNLARLSPEVPFVVVAKGAGVPIVDGNFFQIPLGPHPRDLAHALISESTYSPLVTGDGSLSSALETAAVIELGTRVTARTRGRRAKSFLYELNSWKAEMISSWLFDVFRKSDGESLAAAERLMIAPSPARASGGASDAREKRVAQIQAALVDFDTHTKLVQFLAARRGQLDMGRRLMELTRLRGLFQRIEGLPRAKTADYLAWLVSQTGALAEKVDWQTHLERGVQRAGVNRDSKRLLDVWYSLATLWFLERPVPEAWETKAVRELSEVFSKRETEKRYQIDQKLQDLFAQIAAVPTASRRMQTLLDRNPDLSRAMTHFEAEFEDAGSGHRFPWNISTISSTRLRCEDLWSSSGHH
ncbi:MAG: hypothetical protein NDI61_07755 [Bdellovibrionaceae bacterium]|nr:hypothetical protein [Pseudobdellovibrionaceae bacterium]